MFINSSYSVKKCSHMQTGPLLCWFMVVPGKQNNFFFCRFQACVARTTKAKRSVCMQRKPKQRDRSIHPTGLTYEVKFNTGTGFPDATLPYLFLVRSSRWWFSFWNGDDSGVGNAEWNHLDLSHFICSPAYQWLYNYRHVFAFPAPSPAVYHTFSYYFLLTMSIKFPQNKILQIFRNWKALEINK